MQVIIDGYNLIYAWGWMPKNSRSSTLVSSRDRLLRELAAQIPLAARHQIAIVFDAPRKAGVVSKPAALERPDGIEQGLAIFFSQAYDEADSMIEAFLRQAANPRKLAIVSSDQRLMTAAKRRQAVSIRSQDFWDRLPFLLRRATSSSGAVGNQSTSSASLNSADVELKKLDEQTIRSLVDVDWLHEFGLTEEAADLELREQSLDSHPTAAASDVDSALKAASSPPIDSFSVTDRLAINPFPPGYLDQIAADEELADLADWKPDFDGR